jgi:hypothetical protein
MLTILASLTQEKMSGYDQNHICLYFHDRDLLSEHDGHVGVSKGAVTELHSLWSILRPV